ncbi:MAG: NTPase [Nitrososphaeria archaeon]
MVKKIFVTGDPGVGKSTLLSRVVYQLRSKGLMIGGVLTRDIRERGVRTGFQIQSLSDGTTGILASVSLKVGPKIGKYVVNLNDLKNVFASAILYAIDFSDVVVCDEVGPMELLSPEVRKAIETLIECNKPVLGSVHKRLRDPIIEKISNSPNIKVYELTIENRDQLIRVIVDEVSSNLWG